MSWSVLYLVTGVYVRSRKARYHSDVAESTSYMYNDCRAWHPDGRATQPVVSASPDPSPAMFATDPSVSRPMSAVFFALAREAPGQGQCE